MAKMSKMREKMHQQITQNQAPAVFSSCLSGLNPPVYPRASTATLSNPFSSAFCRMGAFISCMMELNCSCWLPRGKSSLNPIIFGRGRLLLSTCTCGTQPHIFKYSRKQSVTPGTFAGSLLLQLLSAEIKVLLMLG